MLLKVKFLSNWPLKWNHCILYPLSSHKRLKYQNNSTAENLVLQGFQKYLLCTTHPKSQIQVFCIRNPDTSRYSFFISAIRIHYRTAFYKVIEYIHTKFLCNLEIDQNLYKERQFWGLLQKRNPRRQRRLTMTVSLKLSSPTKLDLREPFLGDNATWVETW